MIVFLRFGEFLTGGDHFSLTSDALKKVLTGKASIEILLSIVRAVCQTWITQHNLIPLEHIEGVWICVVKPIICDLNPQ